MSAEQFIKDLHEGNIEEAIQGIHSDIAEGVKIKIEEKRSEILKELGFAEAKEEEEITEAEDKEEESEKEESESEDDSEDKEEESEDE